MENQAAAPETVVDKQVETKCSKCNCRNRGSKHIKENERLSLGVGPDLHRPDNKVVTAKYTLITFLPYSFFGQFRHFSNAYFLVIFIIAIIGDTQFSSLNWYQSPYDATGFLLSLAVVVGVSMSFDLAYDIGRHREDRKVNSRTARRLIQGNEEEIVPWYKLRPGDLVVVDREHMFPADLLFLTARKNPHNVDDEFDETKCYVETSNIDGETNLKVRFTPKNIQYSHVQDDDWWIKLVNWSIIYDRPKPQLEFSGHMTYTAEDKNEATGDIETGGEKKDVSLDFRNILLRGSILKNTHEVIGVVLYAGIETKGVLSSSVTKTKISNAMILVNRAILVILFVGLIMVLISAGLASETNQNIPYLGNPVPYVFGPFWSSFFTFVILYSNLLPISLVIATTITNFIQAQFVGWDIQMYDKTKDRPAKCATLELAQEIGQVSFVFSDKTGTLTRNEMKLVACTIGLSRSFGVGRGGGILDPLESDKSTEEIFADALDCVHSPDIRRREAMREFLTTIALCHTVLVEGEGDEMKYNAEGPDEEALVNGVAALGFKLVKTSRSTYVIESNTMPLLFTAGTKGNTLHSYEILAVNSFDSNRKRMSCIVRFPDGTLQILVKGADSVMVERLEKTNLTHEMTNHMLEHLNNFARNGLRTLVMARRPVSLEEYERFVSAVDAANSSLHKEKEEKLANAAATLETNLQLVGASAIEDRLQEGVADTLKCLRDAGIKTWVLTGDKVETAVNIGFSSGLLTPDMSLIEITKPSLEENLDALKEASKRLDPKSLEDIMKKRHFFSPTNKRRVSLGADATGEDPYEIIASTQKIVENGFLSLAEGGRFVVRKSLGRKKRTSSKEMDFEETSDRLPDPLVYGQESGSLDLTDKQTLEDEDDANETTLETDMSSMVIGQNESFLKAEASMMLNPIPEEKGPLPQLLRQTSAVIPHAEKEASNLALIISGDALNGLLNDPKTKNPISKKDDPHAALTKEEHIFLNLAKVCKVVLACRVNPRQKALLVRLVRRGVVIGNKEPITLAIGDGANDVAMIQEARVGVGIAGREGSQAVNAADFSIGQFRFLRRLLLVHGRWNYRRMALLVLFIFYAHIVPVLCAFAYNILNYWSGTAPFPFTWTIAYSYLVVIPCIFVAAFNRDITAKSAFAFPAIYVSGRANLHMGRFKIFEYIFKAISHSAIICGLIYGAFAFPTINYLELGTTIYLCVLFTVLLRLGLECYTWTIITIVIYLLFFIIFPILEVLIYQSDTSLNTLWGTTVLFGPSAVWVWTTTWIVVMTCVLLDVTLSIARRTFFPNLIDLVIETDRGYRNDGSLKEVVKYLKLLSRPEQLNREAVREAVTSVSNIPVAPANRSAFAYDVPEESSSSLTTPKAKSRITRFSYFQRKSRTKSQSDITVNGTSNSAALNVSASNLVENQTTGEEMMAQRKN